MVLKGMHRDGRSELWLIDCGLQISRIEAYPIAADFDGGPRTLCRLPEDTAAKKTQQSGGRTIVLARKHDHPMSEDGKLNRVEV